MLDEPADQVTYATVRTLLDRHALDDESYAQAAALLGDCGLLKLLATVGYYTTVSMTAAVFEIPT